MPFTLGESEEFLKERKIILDRYQLIQLYMVMGGSASIFENDRKRGELNVGN
jgi:hypothetical protein